ncbi:protein of unknown function (plasmid) [Cupriavidus neocaledonicus]|uniref:Uncharacterized protein n=1 Tax=Cupriavidus neocaledonicus TaxID=1040979 RepID=A0A375HT03_9BURK|nr:hypothetical protein CBM2605_B70108 [Cupriavidus neocaledonicus]SPD60545.1 protein of unknown function [Cupriavidus neocaledonicus]
MRYSEHAEYFRFDNGEFHPEISDSQKPISNGERPVTCESENIRPTQRPLDFRRPKK